MTGVLDTVQDYAQRHPMSVAAGLIIALPGTYMFITGKSIPCATPGVDTIAKKAGLCSDPSSPSHSPAAGMTSGLSVYESQHPLDVRLSLPISRWTDMPTRMRLLQILDGTRKNFNSFLSAKSERLGLNLHSMPRSLEGRWTDEYPFHRLISIAITTALPGAFLLFIRHHPESWAARYQTQVANVLHILALVTIANQKISVQDLLVAALVMVSFEAWQRIFHSVTNNEVPNPHSPAETLLPSTHSVVADSDIVVPGTDIGDFSIADSKDEEILRLQKTLADIKTADKKKENDLKRTQNDLRNARDTLNETFVEYSSLRDEMKTMKASIGRDHQAIVYRKDIELFALRKAIEQKENYVKDKDSKLEEITGQHKATLELKNAQIRNLKERIAFSEGPGKEKTNGDTNRNGEHHSAVQVKLLRIKGRNSSEQGRSEEDKETEIAGLGGNLVGAEKASEVVVHLQHELRQARDATFETQNSLNEERQHHIQTRHELQETNHRLEAELKKNSQMDSPTKLPTINEHDHKELEAMFNAAQQDNLRLYSDLDATDKHLREASARLSANEQELASLKEQLKLEQAINADIETARPSLVHRVHFQRLEGQLKESRDLLATKDDEIQLLQRNAAANDSQVKDLKKDKELADSMRTQLQGEIEKLKKSITELESTKEQLMLDHERLAKTRARDRNVSAEHTSARNSDATLVSRPESHLIMSSDIPLPPRPVTVAADTNFSDSNATDANRASEISNDVPPPQLRSIRRKSLTLKGLMRKMTKKEQDEKLEKEVKGEKEQQRPKTALAPKDKNAQMRPKTAAPQKENVVNGSAEAARQKSTGWSQSRKLVRKSMG